MELDDEARVKQLAQETGLDEAEAREILFGPPPLTQKEQNLNFLAESFPEISEKIREHSLESAQNDLDKATELLLNYSALQQEKGEDPQHFVRQQKRALKDGRKRAKNQSRLETGEEASVKAIAEVLKTSEEKAWELYTTWDHNVSMAIMHGSAHLIDARSVDRLLGQFGYTSGQAQTKSVASPKKQWDGYTVRQLVNEIRTAQTVLRNETERATRYSREKNEKRAIATEAASKAFEARERLKELDVELKSRSHEYQAHRGVLDLHGLEARAAERVILRHLDELSETLRTETPGELEIVTGAGIHSHKGIPVLKNLARAILDEHRWRYTELPGSFVVTRKL